MSNKCGLCKETITRDKVICDGICDMQFHSRCVELNSTAVKLLNENKNIKFVCDGCTNSTTKLLLQQVNLLIENRCNDSQNSILENIVTEIMDIKKVLINCDDNMKEIKKVTNNKINSESYADKVKNMKEKNVPVVMVVPKKTQDSGVTNTYIKKMIDPKEIPIHSVRNISNGAVLLTCSNNKSVEEITRKTHEKLGDKYSVSVPKPIKPKIKIVGLSEEISEDEIVEHIRAQNDFIKNGEIKVLHTYFRNIGNYRRGSVIIEVDGENFENIIRAQRINIGWNRCVVYEYLNVKICYKCNGYNHKSTVCTRQKTCRKCGGEHDLKECNEQLVNCINCITINKSLKFNFDVNHYAGSRECNVLQRKLSVERSKTKYNV